MMHLHRKFRLIATLVLLVGALSAALPLAALAGGGPGQKSTSPVHEITVVPPDIFVGEEIEGAWSKLVRNDAGVSMTFHTSELTPGDTVTAWWIIFNYPGECNEGEGGPCGLLDLFDTDVQGTVLYAAGHVIGGSGKGNFGRYRSVGDSSDYVMGAADSLLNPRAAQIRLALRSHGPAIPGLVSEQINTYGGGCDVEHGGPLPVGVGYPCDEFQASAHAQ